MLWTIFEGAIPIGHVQVGPLPLDQATLSPKILAFPYPSHFDSSLPSQVAQFQTLPCARFRLLIDNFRPQQPLEGRRIFASPGTMIRASASPLTLTLAGAHQTLLGLGLCM